MGVGNRSRRRKVGDAGEEVGEPSLRVDVVELGGLDQRVEDGGALATAIRAAEKPGLATERHAAERPFGGVVGEAYLAAVEDATERVPAPQHVVDRLGGIVAPRQLADLCGKPGVELSHQRGAVLLAYGEPLGGSLAVDGALDLEQGIEPLHASIAIG